ncbi:hypothetical protein AeMF1_009563 [Aphanomyces euteiches]|nr:hypothetical protein AeMF1_009563 [Aphanomyces euteiches]KAH9190380.1 hypothetical protein AeNC1_007642 [Aphanomyces euteiches]
MTKTPTERRPLGLVSVALLSFFSVCGGPFGSEQIVSACGPLVGLTSLLLFPLVYSLPLNLLLAELCSAFPIDSSFCTWVGLAFGRSWGFYVGYWSWLASTFDAAVYPCLVTDSLFMNMDTSWEMKTLVRIALLTLFMIPTLFSINFVGKASVWLAVVVLVPFVVLIVTAVPQMNFHHVLAIGPEMDWTQLISLLFWNFRGFDAMGAYAGEIHNPQANFHRAMLLSLFIISATYMLPLLAAAAVNKPNYTTWTDGEFPTIAQFIGGAWLAQWVAISNGVSSFGLYFVESTANGFRLTGMADIGFAPRWFMLRDGATGCPRRSILFIYGLGVAMCAVDFSTILGVTNALSILAQLVQSCAGISLRYTHADIQRPYRVNLDKSALAAVMALPIALGVAIFVNQLCVNSITVFLTGGAIIIGVVFRFLMQLQEKGYERIAKENDIS